MTRQQFFIIGKPIDITSIVAPSDGEFVNVDETRLIARVSGFGSPDGDSAVFVDTKKGAKAFSQMSLSVGIVFTTSALKGDLPSGVPLLLHDFPKAAFADLIEKLYTERWFEGRESKIDRAENCFIHSTAVIGDGVKLGEGVRVGPLAVIGPGVEIGAYTTIEQGASVVHSLIGEHVRIGAGARIGGTGLGVIPSPSGLRRMPHLGAVIIDDHVRIDANCTIDRGVLEDTKIGCGSQLDCAVHIAHNVTIGKDCVFAGQTGISGSVRIGDRVQIGGKVGIADHVEIGDDVQIAGGSGIMRNIPAGERWGGYPAMPARKWLKEVALVERRVSKKGKREE